MSRPLRVVHVITSLTTGGAERQLELLVTRSVNDTATIALYAGGPVAESLAGAGERVEVLGTAGWRRFAAPVVLARRLRAYRPDVVHVHLLSAQLWGIPAARLAGVPVVVSSEHSLMDDSIEGRPLTWWLRGLYRVLESMTTTTVAVSETTATRLRRWGVTDERIAVSDNGIDFESLSFDLTARSALRAELGIDDDATVIGAVGRLDPVKRMDTVVRAAAPLLRDGAHLVVAGTGPLRHDLERLAAGLRVTDRVHWLGARPDMATVLSGLDVLVSASADETFGMAVVEAVGNGLPVAYVQAPALEELDLGLPWLRRVEPHPNSTDAATPLREALTELLDQHAGPRHVVPTELTERYGADAAAERLDHLHAALVEQSAR